MPSATMWLGRALRSGSDLLSGGVLFKSRPAGPHGWDLSAPPRSCRQESMPESVRGGGTQLGRNGPGPVVAWTPAKQGTPK